MEIEATSEPQDSSLTETSSVTLDFAEKETTEHDTNVKLHSKGRSSSFQGSAEEKDNGYVKSAYVASKKERSQKDFETKQPIHHEYLKA